MDVVLERPWRNLKAYAEARRAEAVAELRVAFLLLEAGYTRTAAGKVFQAFKSLLAALAAERREELKSLKGLDKIIAYVPTRVIRELASLLGLEKEAWVALALHQYQYNGPDPEGAMCIYPDRDAAVRDICWLGGRLAELLGSFMEEVRLFCGGAVATGSFAERR